MSEYPQDSRYGGGRGDQTEAPAYGSGAYGEQSSNPYSSANSQQQTYGDGQATYPAYGAPQNYPLASNYGDNSTTTYPAQPDHQTDEDKGLAGALAGGVAGAYGGHQVNHGFIGAVGGAWAGSKLEDKYKESHQEPKKEEHHHHFFHRRHSSSSSEEEKKHEQAFPIPIAVPVAHSHVDQGKAGQWGNFSHTSTDIMLEVRTMVMEARCANVQGDYVTSRLNLNEVIATVGGQFKWVFSGPRGDLGYSVKDIRVEYQEREGSAPAGWYLKGRVKDGRGELREAMIFLDKNIENRNGRLTFCRYDTRDGIFLG
jgi:hypothetical protein